MKKRTIALFIFIGILLFSSLVFAQGKSSRIQYLYIDQIKYISLDDLVTIYGGKLNFNYIQKKAYWEVNEHQVVLSLFSPYVLLDGKTYNLGYEVKFKKGAIYVPLKNFYPLLQKIKAGETQLDEESQSSLLEKELEKATVTQLKASKKLNGVLIEIFISGPSTYEVFLPGNDWLNVNFYQAQIDTAYFSELEIPGIVKEAKAFQFENSAQLSLLLDKSYDIFSDSVISDPYRIQISMEDTTSQFTRSHLESIARRTDLVDVVIIDPGHGGDDWGNVGPEGLTEKEVVLDIAKKLQRLFQENSNMKAFLTRESDISLPTEQRARFANEKGGDILVSLHANFSHDPTQGGFQIFIPGKAKTKEDSMAQVLENRSSDFNPGDEIQELSSYMDSLPHDTSYNKFMKESEAVALLVQEELEKVVHTENKGISQADFLVLRKAYMPGILIQLAHISSPYEELLLREEIFKQWVAQALYKAIIRFKERSPESL
jgi:N-acetylmuramoyl-L-alanine amidase